MLEMTLLTRCASSCLGNCIPRWLGAHTDAEPELMCSCQTAGGQLQNLPAPQQSLILPGAGSDLAEQVPQLVHLRSLGLVLILTASGTLRAGAALCLCSSTQQLPADRSTFVLLLCSARVIDEIKPDIKQAETLRAWQAGSGMAAAAPALITALHAWHRPQESSGTGLLAERQMLSMSGVLTWHLMHAFRCMLDCGNRVLSSLAWQAPGHGATACYCQEQAWLVCMTALT